MKLKIISILSLGFILFLATSCSEQKKLNNKKEEEQVESIISYEEEPVAIEEPIVLDEAVQTQKREKYLFINKFEHYYRSDEFEYKDEHIITDEKPRRHIYTLKKNKIGQTIDSITRNAKYGDHYYSFTYLPTGELEKEINNSFTREHFYDDEGRLEKVITSATKTPSLIQSIRTVIYEPKLNKSISTHRNLEGTIIDKQTTIYDDLGRMLEQTRYLINNVEYHIVYTYLDDKSSLLKQKTRSSKNSVERFEYTYDSDFTLQKIECFLQDGYRNLSQNFKLRDSTFDAQNNLIKVQTMMNSHLTVEYFEYGYY